METSIELIDTTLRDGEQTHNVAFSPQEKLHIAILLLDKLKLDRIEVASARVSKGEQEAVAFIVKWACKRELELKKDKEKMDLVSRIEVLGFIDKHLSVDWLKSCGGETINLLTKGSLNHLENQLKKTPKQHFKEITSVVDYAHKNKMNVNIYLEDWSNGFMYSEEYVYEMLEILQELPIRRFMLPDTLGVLYPTQVFKYVSQIIKDFPQLHFDFHPHNDYGLATINVLEAIRAGVHGVHCTMNCLGERTGNASLAEVVANIKDHLHLKLDVNEKFLYPISKVVETYSGKRLADNTPITGADVFTQTAGIHADGDKKGNLYQSTLSPARFGRKRSYALGKLAGKASLEQNFKDLGLELSKDDFTRVLAKVIELGDQKKTVYKEDLPFIVASVLQVTSDKKILFLDVVITLGFNLEPVCTFQVLFKGKKYRCSGKGDGGYDAFMKALDTWAKEVNIIVPKLMNYEIRIPPGGKTSALVECKITWDFTFNNIPLGKGFSSGVKQLTTRGVHGDQVLAAIEATEKMLNIFYTKFK